MTNEELVRDIKAGHNEKIEQLYTQNQGIIRKIANRFSSYEETEDLTQEAFLILCEAVKAFDEEKAVFSTFFYNYLKWGFSRYIFRSRNAMRISNKTLENVTKYRRFVGDYKATIGKDPTESEITFYLKLSAKQFERVKKAIELLKDFSLDRTNEEGFSLADTIADPVNMFEAIEEEIDNSREAVELWGEVDKLPQLQSKCVKERFIEQATLSQIGERNGTTAEGARRAVSTALNTLRRNRTTWRIARDRGLTQGYYKGGLGLFLSTGLSSTEREAFKNIGVLYEA